jgi:Xaa-Pro aminopeptidase
MNNLRKKMSAENLGGLIITHLDHIRYLVGYTGSAGLLILNNKTADFFTDSRYTLQAKKQVKGARVHTVSSGLIAALADFPKLNVKNRVYGIEHEYVTLTTRKQIAGILPDCVLVEADSIMIDLGWVKEKEEVQYITKAADIADTAYERILQLVRPGIRESELAAELEYQMAIVASGFRSAMPHGIASQKKIKKGDFITFDFGATINGYVSDMTRTVVVGKATSRQKKVYDTVKRAQAAGCRKIKAGVNCSAIDSACRKVIEKAGFGKYFTHGTGHGIGFFIHTGPRLSETSKDKLMSNNIVTVEPGIYIEGWGGVRIEDDVLVTRSGGKILNRSEKKLLEL